MAQTNPIYPPQNNAEAIELNIFNAKQFHQVLHGDTETSVMTFEGNADIPSVAKALSDSAAYKAPIAWSQGDTQTDLLQPRIFNSFLYVPISVPQTLGAQPTDAGWKLYLQNVDASFIDQGFNYYREVVTGSEKRTFTLPFTYVTEIIGNNAVANMFITVDGTDVDLVTGVSYPADNQITLTTPVNVGQTLQVRSETIATFSIVRDLVDDAETAATNAASSAASASTSAASASTSAANALATEGRITTEGDTQVGRVNSAGDLAVARVVALPEFGTNTTQILEGTYADLLRGDVDGTEGRWRKTFDVDYVLQTTTFSSDDSSTWLIFPPTGGTSRDFGTPVDFIDVDTFGYVIGDSGTPYTLRAVRERDLSPNVSAAYIHPKHGDVRNDFTVSSTYNIKVFQESSATADQQVGASSRVEYILGGGAEAIGSERYVSQFSAREGFDGWIRGGDLGNNTFSGGVLTTDPNGSDVNSGSIFRYRLASPVTTRRIVIECELLSSSGSNFIRQLVSGQIFDLGSDTFRKGETVTIDYTFPTERVISVFELRTNVDATVDMLRVDSVKFYSTSHASKDLGSLFPLNGEGVENLGYFNGSEWVPQLMQNSIFSNDIIGIKLSKNKTQSATQFQVLNSSNAWITSPLMAFPPTGVSHSEDNSDNAVFINTGSAYTQLGFASAEDMRLNSALRIVYDYRSRILRPEPLTTGAASNLTATQTIDYHNRTPSGDFVSELTGYVPISVSNFRQNVIPDSRHIRTAAEYLFDVRYTPERFINNLNGALTYAVLAPRNGTYAVLVYFVEVVSDSDSGMTGIIQAAGNSNIQVEPDDNGNITLAGVMSYDTGVPV